eukprot:26014_1
MSTSTKEWLRKLDFQDQELDEYNSIFSSNGFEKTDFLKHITKIETLKEFGIAKLGHRLHIWNGIIALQTHEINNEHKERSIETPNNPSAGPQPNQHDKIFDDIKIKDQIVTDKLNINKDYKQHHKLNEIHPIKHATINTKRDTINKNQIIKTMQEEYNKSRLDKIPKNILQEEFNIRVQISNLMSEISSKRLELIQKMSDEINNSSMLKSCRKTQNKSKKIERTQHQYQYKIQNIFNETKKVIEKLQQCIELINTYTLNKRNILIRINDIYYAKANYRSKLVEDEKVVNYFLKQITSAHLFYDKLSNIDTEYKLKINSNLYQKAFGNLNEIEAGHIEHKKTNEQRSEKYEKASNLRRLYAKQMDIDKCQKIMNKCGGYVKSIEYIKQNKEFNVILSPSIIEVNNLCSNWLNGECDETLCRRKHEINGKLITKIDNNKPKQMVILKDASQRKISTFFKVRKVCGKRKELENKKNVQKQKKPRLSMTGISTLSLNCNV